MNRRNERAEALPPLCHLRGGTAGKVLLIQRGVDGFTRIDTKCSPECLNSKLSRVPTRAGIAAMQAGELYGWYSPGTDPAGWSHLDGED